MVKAIVPTGKHLGMHKGKVLVRASGYFDIKTSAGRIGGINHRHCSLLSRGDGYNYRKEMAHLLGILSR